MICRQAKFLGKLIPEYICISLWSDLWPPFQQCPLMWWIYVTSFVETRHWVQRYRVTPNRCWLTDNGRTVRGTTWKQYSSAAYCGAGIIIQQAWTKYTSDCLLSLSCFHVVSCARPRVCLGIGSIIWRPRSQRCFVFRLPKIVCLSLSRRVNCVVLTRNWNIPE